MCRTAFYSIGFGVRFSTSRIEEKSKRQYCPKDDSDHALQFNLAVVFATIVSGRDSHGCKDQTCNKH